MTAEKNEAGPRYWYYLKGEEKVGPIEQEQLISLFHSGSLSADILVWTKDFSAWHPARLIMKKGTEEPLLILPEFDPPPPPKSLPPPTEQIATSAPVREERRYGGLTRTPYVIGMVGALFLLAFIRLEFKLESEFVLFHFISASIVLPLVWYRLVNIGDNPLLALVLIIPVGNIIIGLRCLIFPEGYAYTQKLDAAGWVLAILFVSVFLLVIASVFMS